MFCYQCQEAAKGTGCVKMGICGKKEETANLQDLLIYVSKGVSLLAEESDVKNVGRFLFNALFATVTNVNFDDARLIELIKEGLKLREELMEKTARDQSDLHDSALWFSDDISEFYNKAKDVGVEATENEDVRSLRELLVYGLKGIAAYGHHAHVLGKENDEVYSMLIEGMASTTKKLSVDEMVALVLKAGDVAVKVMALLDEANTSAYGHPEITEVNIGVGSNPGILISGHDLKDMEELLKQTDGTGVDVYTHGEMLPSHYYPAFKKYGHLVGNYGGSWWKQGDEFDSFNGPILMTTNCITPVKDSYKDRIWTTGSAAYTDVNHIPDRENGGSKDFSPLIEAAKKCPAPKELESGKIVGGFAHNQVLALADKVVDAVKSGAIKRFVVMAGCDGRHKERDYFEQVAQNLPKDAVILTAGCAKFRYNKLGLGDIGGIPRVLDAGQCNDCYSLAVVALKLKEVFQLENINDLPLSFDVAWYEQKAVTVLLALLALGVKGIRLGPSLPAFLSPNVAKVLIENFDIKGINTPEEDVKNIMDGR